MDRTNAVEFLRSLSRYTETRNKLSIYERDLHYHLKQIRSLLPDKEYKVLLKRHVDQATFEDVGKSLTVSRQRVQQIEQRALQRIRNIVERTPHNLPEVSDD